MPAKFNIMLSLPIVEIQTIMSFRDLRSDCSTEVYRIAYYGDKMPLDKEQMESAEICFGTSCNFCERGCPVYQQKKVRTYSSRGKNRITLGLSRGFIKPSRELADTVYLCTSCGNCDRWCALPNTKDFRKLRSYLIGEGFENEKARLNVENIKRYGNPYAEQGRDAWQTRHSFSKDAHTLLFVGCTMPLKEPKILDIIISTLGPTSLSVIKNEPCCGSYPLRTGYTNIHEKLADRLLEYIVFNKINEVVTVCAGCYSTIKETLDEKMPSVKVIHYTEKIARDVLAGRLKLKRKYGKITYHDPCHLGRLGGIFDSPREILLKTGTLVEMKHNRFESLCCGSGGGVRAAYPEIAKKIAKKRIKEAQDIGAEVLVTACPLCEGMLKSVGEIPVKDIIEIINDCRE